MFRYNKLMSRGLLIIAFFLLTVNTYKGQIQNKDILEQKISLSIKTGNLFQICGGLAHDGVPIGFEGATDFNMNERKNIRIKNDTLKEVLDSIVKQDPKYSWEIRDGVVNIYPIYSRNEKIKILLTTNVKSFSVKKEVGKEGVKKIIYELDEINKILTSKQIKFSIFAQNNLFVEDATSDISFSNTNLRDILNKIVNNNGDKNFWSIIQTAEEPLFHAC